MSLSLPPPPLLKLIFFFFFVTWDSSLLLLLLLLFGISFDPLLQKNPPPCDESALVSVWAICLPCEMLALSSSPVTASPGIIKKGREKESRQQILVLTAGRSDDNETVLILYLLLSLCFFCIRSSDHTDRPDCSQNQSAGFPGAGGLSWVSHGCLLCR